MDEKLPWHEQLWRQLQLYLSNQRLPHALLLAGRPGLGKLTFARRLARALLCDNPDAGGDSCGYCRSCCLFKAYSHPDFSRVNITGDSKSVGIDQIRALENFLSLTSHYGGYKIALLEDINSLNINAMNSLLKTLEEPQDNSLLLLLSAQPSRLPATIRSRCQLVRFKSPITSEAIAWLTPRVDSTLLHPQILLDISAGAPLAALDIANVARWNHRHKLFESYEQVSGGGKEPIQTAESWMQGDLNENISWLISWHTDMIRLSMVSVPPWLGNPDLCSFLKRLASRWTIIELFERLDAAIRLYILCSTTQVNAQLMLEVFLSESAT
jgi:DNA polymerase-3 subunit delta'